MKGNPILSRSLPGKSVVKSTSPRVRDTSESCRSRERNLSRRLRGKIGRAERSRRKIAIAEYHRAKTRKRIRMHIPCSRDETTKLRTLTHPSLCAGRTDTRKVLWYRDTVAKLFVAMHVQSRYCFATRRPRRGSKQYLSSFPRGLSVLGPSSFGRSDLPLFLSLSLSAR